MRDDIYLVDVVARATDEQRVSLATLRNVQVPLPNGRTVPLSQFATFDFDQEFPLIWRRDRVPTLTVQADVAPGALPEAVVATLAPAVDETECRPAGPITSRSAARSRKARNSQASVIAVVPLMLLMMLTFLMIQLQSFSACSGAQRGADGADRRRRGAAVFQRPLGFVAILGILALIGMIASNAVILIEQIEAERARGQGGLGRGDRRQRVALPPDHADGRSRPCSA